MRPVVRNSFCENISQKGGGGGGRETRSISAKRRDLIAAKKKKSRTSHSAVSTGVGGLVKRVSWLRDNGYPVDLSRYVIHVQHA